MRLIDSRGSYKHPIPFIRSPLPTSPVSDFVRPGRAQHVCYRYRFTVQYWYAILGTVFCNVCELAVFTLSLPHQRKLKALKAIFVCGVCGAQCAFA